MGYLGKAKEQRVTGTEQGIWSRELKDERVTKNNIYQLHNFVYGLVGYLLGCFVGIYEGRHLDQQIGRNNFELTAVHYKGIVCVWKEEVQTAESQIILILPFLTVTLGFWVSYLGLFFVI